jgi:hypothetical protein
VSHYRLKYRAYSYRTKAAQRTTAQKQAAAPAKKTNPATNDRDKKRTKLNGQQDLGNRNGPPNSVLIKIPVLVKPRRNVNVAIQDQRTLTNMAEGKWLNYSSKGNFNKAETNAKKGEDQ